MITPKTPDEIDAMREGGAKLSNILQKLLQKAVPGVSLLEIETLADRMIVEAGGTASFKTVKDYKWATCLCVNDVVVHGIPNNYTLKDGDILTIDVGLLYKGFHTDTAWTKIIAHPVSVGQRVNEPTQNELKEKERFLKVGEDVLWHAIAQAKPGNRVGHISQTIQRLIEGAGYGIVKTLVGHGVGVELHEEPQVPGFLKVPVESTPEFVPGETIAVEVIYAMGMGAVVYSTDDGWSIGTRDGSLSAVFEHTIVIIDGTPEVLTQPHFDKSGAGLTQAP